MFIEITIKGICLACPAYIAQSGSESQTSIERAPIFVLGCAAPTVPVCQVCKVCLGVLQNVARFVQRASHSCKKSSNPSLKLPLLLQAVLTDDQLPCKEEAGTVVALILHKASEELKQIDVKAEIENGERNKYASFEEYDEQVMIQYCGPGSNVMFDYARMTKAEVETEIGTAIANLLHNTQRYLASNQWPVRQVFPRTLVR